MRTPTLTGISTSSLPESVSLTTTPQGSTRRCTSESSGQPNQIREAPSLKEEASPPSDGAAAAAAAAVQASCCSGGASAEGEEAASC